MRALPIFHCPRCQAYVEFTIGDVLVGDGRKRMLRCHLCGATLNLKVPVYDALVKQEKEAPPPVAGPPSAPVKELVKAEAEVTPPGTTEAPPPPPEPPPPAPTILSKREKAEKAVAECGSVQKAAEALDVSRQTVHNWLKQPAAEGTVPPADTAEATDV